MAPVDTTVKSETPPANVPPANAPGPLVAKNPAVAFLSVPDAILESTKQATVTCTPYIGMDARKLLPEMTEGKMPYVFRATLSTLPIATKTVFDMSQNIIDCEQAIIACNERLKVLKALEDAKPTVDTLTLVLNDMLNLMIAQSKAPGWDPHVLKPAQLANWLDFLGLSKLAQIILKNKVTGFEMITVCSERFSCFFVNRFGELPFDEKLLLRYLSVRLIQGKLEGPLPVIASLTQKLCTDLSLNFQHATKLKLTADTIPLMYPSEVHREFKLDLQTTFKVCKGF